MDEGQLGHAERGEDPLDGAAAGGLPGAGPADDGAGAAAAGAVLPGGADQPVCPAGPPGAAVRADGPGDSGQPGRGRVQPHRPGGRIRPGGVPGGAGRALQSGRRHGAALLQALYPGRLCVHGGRRGYGGGDHPDPHQAGHRGRPAGDAAQQPAGGGEDRQLLRPGGPPGGSGRVRLLRRQRRGGAGLLSEGPEPGARHSDGPAAPGGGVLLRRQRGVLPGALLVSGGELLGRPQRRHGGAAHLLRGGRDHHDLQPPERPSGG